MLWQYIVLVTFVNTVRAKIEGYIVGGEVTMIQKHPHAVFLFINCEPKANPYIAWICGASVINQMLLLTAAHCIFECHNNVKITATIGDANRTIGIQREARSIVTHENFSMAIFADDIGIIKLAKQLQFSEKVKRVALMKNPPYKEKAKIAGWGDTIGDTVRDTSHKIGSAGSLLLKQTEQWVWSSTDCQQFFGYNLDSRTICASVESTKNFASSGDSGSALLVRGYIQIGTMSFRVPDKAQNVGIYTDVGAFYDWIAFKAEELYCS